MASVDFAYFLLVFSSHSETTNGAFYPCSGMALRVIPSVRRDKERRR
jgi:hypothetical protein